MIFHNSYCLHKNKKKNNRKVGELNPGLLRERQLCLPHNHESNMINYQILKGSFSQKILEISRIFRNFQGFSTVKKGDTILSYTYGTLCVQLRFMITFTDSDGIFAPSCTSREIPLKVGFTIETKTKMQKLLGFLEILEKMAFIPKSLG